MSLANDPQRISISGARNTLLIEIRFPHSALWVASRVVVLGLAGCFGYATFTSLVQGFPVASLVERGLIILFTTAVLAWQAAILLDTLLRLLGREKIAVENESLVLSTELLGMRFSNRFLLSEVRRFRLLEHRFENRRRKRMQRRIAFEYRGRQVGTRGNLSRKEGELLYELLTPYFSDAQPLGERGPEPANEIPE